MSDIVLKDDCNYIEAIKNAMHTDKFRAAYALNMCTVSVSQIIDYEDINILEQEYEAILNNLNLELIPKDEALLDILKQLLDTITFFKMSEGDKKFIEQEYQHKLKNAIWSAVPNFGMIFAGGLSPAAVALSLASQVGIGYMNYRKNKAEYSLEKDKEYWKLQRAAIEQFNGLRRELFTTAWRLADTHKFPDNYRLTENQIKQYNEILIDEDALRRFERLEYVKEGFFAYPPYWYYLGHAANEISMDNKFSDETRDYYKKTASLCFEISYSFNDIDILRRDELMASCTLEYVDLLDITKDKKKICELLDFARKAGAGSADVLQICAFSYLKIGEYKEASKLFRFLTNEQYNTVLNAQLLSQIYVDEYIRNKNTEIKRLHETLGQRLNSRYLMPLPETDSISQEQISLNFINEQKTCLDKGFTNLCKLIFQKYVINLNKLIPCPNPAAVDDYYYSNEITALNRRRSMMEEYLSHSTKIADSYKNSLRNIELQYDIIKALNELLDTIKVMNVVFDSADISSIVSGANEILTNNSTLLNKVQEDMKDGLLIYESYEKTERFFDEIIRNILKYVLGFGKKKISECSNMADIATVEDCLVKVCGREGFSTNILSVNGFSSSIVETGSLPTQNFSLNVFGKNAAVNQRLIDSRVFVVKAVKDHLSRLLVEQDKKSKAKPEVYMNGSSMFDQYVSEGKNNELYIGVKSKIAAFIVDKHSHFDLIITAVGIYIKQVRFGQVEMSDLIPFEKIEQKDDKTLLLDGVEYKNPILNITEFMTMVQQIKDGK